MATKYGLLAAVIPLNPCRYFDVIFVVSILFIPLTNSCLFTRKKTISLMETSVFGKGKDLCLLSNIYLYRALLLILHLSRDFLFFSSPLLLSTWALKWLSCQIYGYHRFIAVSWLTNKVILVFVTNACINDTVDILVIFISVFTSHADVNVIMIFRFQSQRIIISILIPITLLQQLLISQSPVYVYCITHINVRIINTTRDL